MRETTKAATLIALGSGALVVAGAGLLQRAALAPRLEPKPAGVRTLAPRAGALERSVLVVMLDDVAQEDLEEVIADGYAPTLEGLAASGWTFEPTPGMRGGFASPLCAPSRACLAFGRWSFDEWGIGCTPSATGLPDPAWVSLGELAATVAPPLSRAWIGKWHLGEGAPASSSWWLAPNLHGFSTFHGLAGNVLECGGTGYGLPGSGTSWLYYDGGAAPALSSAYCLAELEADLVAFWTSTSGSKLAVWAPPYAHEPYGWPPPSDLPPGYPTVGATRPRFLGMVAALDLQLGRILGSVDLASTLVVVVGDNGTPNAARPLGHYPEGHPLYPGVYNLEAKKTCGERGIRVPFILAGGGLAPKVVPRLAHLADVLPTVADYLGVPAPAGIDGVSLVAPTSRSWVLCGLEHGGFEDWCARTAQFKLRVTGSGTAQTERLFDLTVDPLELDPLPSSAFPAIRAFLRAKLTAAGVP
jgi:arylsulfatase A-like enzyme